MSEIKDIRDKYNSLLEEKEEIDNELKDLESNPLIRRYFELKQKELVLFKEELDLYKKIKFDEYSNCNHVLVTSEVQHDYVEGRKYLYNGCIKCGLNEAVSELEKDEMDTDERIQYEYLRNKRSFSSLQGKHTDEACNIRLAHAIYKRIVECYPNIDDNKLIKYFGSALNGIRKHEVNESRKDSRTKRLNLRKGFSNWTSSGVHKTCK